jgi:hypothetical protein
VWPERPGILTTEVVEEKCWDGAAEPDPRESTVQSEKKITQQCIQCKKIREAWGRRRDSEASKIQTQMPKIQRVSDGSKHVSYRN